MNFELTDKEQKILIIALGSLESMIECPGSNPLFGEFSKTIRYFLKVRDISFDEIKDLVVKLGVREKTVFSEGRGLE